MFRNLLIFKLFSLIALSSQHELNSSMQKAISILLADSNCQLVLQNLNSDQIKTITSIVQRGIWVVSTSNGNPSETRACHDYVHKNNFKIIGRHSPRARVTKHILIMEEKENPKFEAIDVQVPIFILSPTKNGMTLVSSAAKIRKQNLS